MIYMNACVRACMYIQQINLRVQECTEELPIQHTNPRLERQILHTGSFRTLLGLGLLLELQNC